MAEVALEPAEVIERGPQFYRGSHGKPISLSANYLKLMMDEDKGVFEFVVSFRPQVDSRDQRFRLLNQHREVLAGVKVRT